MLTRVLPSGSNKLTENTDGTVIESGDNQRLFGIIIDSNFSFNKHINNLCKKSERKV